jgi:2-polyprenyl-6-methoxyphenol hydroxylase-like FAD-dependent oxidoreductase
MTTAVVLGGGFAGLLAAAVLARRADVTVIESDTFPLGPAPRPGLPQAHHNHVLLAEGAAALDQLLPGTTDELLARGARRYGLTGGALIFGSAGWFRRHDTGASVIACTRWLTDYVIRRRVLAAGGVLVRERTRVLGLTGDATRVTGAVVQPDGAAAREIAADLVIDATGRRSRAPRWLDAIGAPLVAEESQHTGLRYATRVYRAPAELAGVVPPVIVHPAGGGQPDRGATLFPVEGGRWIVTLTGSGDGEPPADEPGFTAFARSLRTPLVGRLMAEAEPAGLIRPFRATVNRRRFFEAAPLPGGFLALGDAVTAVNPVFSHGLSVAALSVLRLSGELDRLGARPDTLAQAQAAILPAAERSWQLATGRGQGPAGPGLARALPGSPVLLTEFFRAQALTPASPPPRGYLEQELSRPPGPLLTEDQAIAQYPDLAGWWRSSPARRQAAVPA